MRVFLRPFHFLLCCFLMAAAGLNAQTPVANYSFAGNANDQSANSNNAAVHGALLTQDRFGFANNAFSFDGVQSHLVAANSAALNSDYTTVAFWIKANDFPVNGEVFPLSFGGWQERWKISLPSHGKLIFTTHPGFCCSDMDSGTPLVIGEWTHVAMTHDGTKDIIYFNGVQVAEKDVAGVLDPTTHPLGIGFDPIDQANFFNGSLDEVQIYDMALSALEVATLYNTQNTPPVIGSEMVAAYSFNNNTTDGTSYANHGAGTDITSVTDRFGFGHSAYSFNGTSSGVVAANSAQLNSANTTISFWVNVAEFPVSGEAFILSSGGWQERWKISLPSHGKTVFTTHPGFCCSDMDSGTPLTIGVWTHVAMTHDGTKDIIYFDGVQVAEKDVAGALDPTTHPLGIGFDPIDNANYFKGSLDEIEIYNYAFSASEIADLYTAQSTFPGTPGTLVAEYKFAGDAEDTSPFENHGVINGATTTADRFGFANNALQFSGNEGVKVDHSIAYNSDNTTISFWVNVAEFPVSGEAFILSNGGWQERWKISLPSHGKTVFTTHPGFCCSDMDSGTPLTIGVWTHVAMTHDGTKDIIYFDGVQVAEKDVAGALDATTYPLGIGYDPIDNNNFFNGSLDDIQIYNVALSAQEIMDLYDLQSQPPVIVDELVADYSFSGNAKDGTPYSNDAQVIGAQLDNDRFDLANKAYTFNGVSDGLLAANSPQLNSANTTISFWINVAEFPVSGEAFILSNGGWQERWKISLPSHGKTVFTTHPGFCCSDMDSGTPLTVGVWTHVAMTHDGTKDIIYFDGAQVAEKDVAGALDQTTYPLGIGYDPIDNANYFKGSLDEVQIYNTALTAQQIADLYAAQSTPPAVTDNEAPSSPLNLTSSVNFNHVSLSWWPSNDNVGVTAYNVFQDGAKVLTTANTSAYFPGLTPLTEFEFSVTAIDEAGNESLPSFLLVTTDVDETPDTEAPTAPGNLAVSAGSTSVLLTWDPSVDNVLVAGYVVFVDGIYFDSLAANVTSVFIGGLDAETAYTFEVYAYDLSGNNSEYAELTASTNPELITSEPGLVAWYPFDGNANDATPYNNHGTIGGTPAFIDVTHPNGTGNKAIVFASNQDSVLAANAVQLISDYTTVGFWIRVDAIPTDAEDYVIYFGNWDQRWKISLPQHLRIVWTTNSSNTASESFVHDMDSGDGNELLLGYWWYVTMVHDGVNDIIYLDGAEVKNLPAEGTLNSTGRPLVMGTNPEWDGSYFKGALDEVKIYNKALTPEEVAMLYTVGSTVVGVNDILAGELANVVQSIYPNPVSKELVVNHSFNDKESLLLRVFDAEGRQVDAIRFDKNAIPADQFSINVENYVSGTYSLNFVSGGKNLGSLKFTRQ